MEPLIAKLILEPSGYLDYYDKDLCTVALEEESVVGILLCQPLSDNKSYGLIELLAKAASSESLSIVLRAAAISRAFVLCHEYISHFQDSNKKQNQEIVKCIKMLKVSRQVLPNVKFFVEGDIYNSLSSSFTGLIDYFVKKCAIHHEIVDFLVVAKENLDLVSYQYEIFGLDTEDFEVFSAMKSSEDPAPVLKTIAKGFGIAKQLGLKHSNALTIICWNALAYVLERKMKERKDLFELLERNLTYFRDLFTDKQKNRIYILYSKLCKHFKIQEKKNILTDFTFREPAEQEKPPEEEKADAELESFFSNSLKKINNREIQNTDFERQFKVKVKSLKLNQNQLFNKFLASLRTLPSSEETTQMVQLIEKVVSDQKVLTKDQLKKFKESTSPQPPKKSQISTEIISTISNQALEILHDHAPTNESFTPLVEYMTRLGEIVRSISPYASLEGYGSAFSGNWISNSEVDLNYLGSEAHNSLETLQALSAEILNQRIGNSQIVETEKGPLLVFSPFNSRVVFNVSVNDFLGKETTALLRKYNELDSRVTELSMFIKIWAKTKGLSDTKKGFPSSFMWNLLVLNFLQTLNPPLIPSLQNKPHQPVNLYNIDVWFDKQYNAQSANPSSLGFLITMFMNHYRNGLCKSPNLAADVKTGSLVEVHSQGILQVLDPFTGRILKGSRMKPESEVAKHVEFEMGQLFDCSLSGVPLKELLNS